MSTNCVKSMKLRFVFVFCVDVLYISESEVTFKVNLVVDNIVFIIV